MLITSVKNLNELKNKISNKGIEIFDSYIEFFSINPIEIKDQEIKEELKNLINELLDLEDVDEVFTNAKP